MIPYSKFALLSSTPMLQGEECSSFSSTAPSLTAQHDSTVNKLRSSMFTNRNVWVKTARQNLLQVHASADAQIHMGLLLHTLLQILE